MRNKKLGKDTIQSFLVRIPVIFLTFCYSILLIKLLGPEGNGLFSFISASVSFSIIFFGLNVKKSTLFHLASKKFNSSKVLGYAVSIHLLAIFVVILFTVFCYIFPSKVSFFFIPKEYYTIFFVLFFLVSFTLQFLTELFKTVLLATKNFKPYNKFLIASSIFQTVAYLVGFLLVRNLEFDVSLVKLFILILSIQLIVCSLSFYLFFVNYADGLSFQNKMIRRPFLKYASLAYVSQIGQFLNKRLDVWFVEFYVGLSGLGIYALATQFTNFLLELISPIQDVLKPYLISMERPEGNLIFSSYFKLVLYLLALASTVLFLFSHLFVTLLFGEVFLNAILPLRILCFGVLLIGLKRVLLAYNTAYNDQKYNVWSQWLGVLATVIFDIILIPTYGIVGAAIASTLSYFCSLLLIMAIFMKQQNVSLSALFIPKKKEAMLLLAYLQQTFSSTK